MEVGPCFDVLHGACDEQLWAVSTRAANNVFSTANLHARLPVTFCCAECQVAIVGKSVIAVWMVLCFLAGVAYCAYRRTQLREKFGIAGAPSHLHLTACNVTCVPL